MERQVAQQGIEFAFVARELNPLFQFEGGLEQLVSHGSTSGTPTASLSVSTVKWPLSESVNSRPSAKISSA